MSDATRDAGGLDDAEAKAFERDVELENLRLRVHELERDRQTWLRGLVTTTGPEAIRRLQRLAAGTEYARVCGMCGLAISQLAAYVEQSPLGHTHTPGQCDVCGRVGSVSPSGDYRGEGDDAP